MKPRSHSFLQTARNSRSLTTSIALSFCFVSVSAQANTDWTGTNSQAWSDATNWSNGVPVENGAQGDTIISIATGNFPTITAAGTYQADFDLRIGTGPNGRLDQSAGTLATGEGNWFFLGYLGAQATYNLTGSGGLKVGGLVTPNGNFLIGLDNGTLSTWNVNTTGTVEAGGIFAGSAGASTGVINMDAGTVSVSGEMQVGGSFFGNGGSGQLKMTGGSVTANVVSFARGNNNAAAITGTAVITGGTLNARQYFTLGFAGGSANVATVSNDGGSVNINTSGGGNMELGVYRSTKNTFNANSGAVTLQNNASILFGVLGHTGQSTFNQNGGTVTFYSDAGSTVGGTGRVVLGDNVSSGTYNYNLNGGTLTTAQISKVSAAATGNFNFNGGTLKAAGSTVTFMQGLTTANVQAGGAIIDSNSFNVTVGQALLDAGGGGGLIKKGAGTLTLSGSSTYSGLTSIEGGTLTLDGTGTIDNSSGVSLGSAGTFDVATKTGYTVKNLTGSGDVFGALTVSTNLAIGNSTGSIDFSSALTFGPASTYTFELVGGGSAADLGNVSGTLTLAAGADLDLVQLGTYTVGDKFTLFSYSGTQSGEFTGLADGSTFTAGGGQWVIDYNDTVAGENGGAFTNFVTVTAVPEPAAALLGSLGLLLLFGRRRN